MIEARPVGHDFAKWIREIGRGPHAARPLASDAACELGSAMLAGEIPPLEFSFTDTGLANELHILGLFAFFQNMLPPAPSSFIYFGLEASPGLVEAWCAQRPDFYRDAYLGVGAGVAAVVSGSWNKWYRTLGGGWAGFVTDGYTNSFGTDTLIDYTVSPTMDVTASPYTFYFATATDFSGNEGKPVMVNTLSGTGETPHSYVLSISSFPNPFNPETTIRYTVPSKGRVTIDIYDVRGARVAALLDGEKPAGAYAIPWGGQSDGVASTSSGVPFSENPTCPTASPPSLPNSAANSGDAASASRASSGLLFRSRRFFALSLRSWMKGMPSSRTLPLTIAATCGPTSAGLWTSAYRSVSDGNSSAGSAPRAGSPAASTTSTATQAVRREAFKSALRQGMWMA